MKERVIIEPGTSRVEMLIEIIGDFFKKIFSKKYSVLIIWLVLGILITYNRIKPNSINNYLIFKYTFFHKFIVFVNTAIFSKRMPPGN